MWGNQKGGKRQEDQKKQKEERRSLVMTKVEDVILKTLERIEGKVDSIIDNAHKRQIGCIQTFATKNALKKSMWSVSVFFSVLILLLAYHPDALEDIAYGVLRVFK